MVKYFCDDCGAELGGWDNIAYQLDNTGHVYCHKCINKHEDLYKSVSYTSRTISTEDKIKDHTLKKIHIKD